MHLHSKDGKKIPHKWATRAGKNILFSNPFDRVSKLSENKVAKLESISQNFKKPVPAWLSMT